MKKAIVIFLFGLLVTAMSACSNNESKNEQASAPVTKQTDGGNEKPTPTPLAGNEVFQQSCITCHSSGDIAGGSTMIDGSKIHSDFKTQAQLLAFVRKNMPRSAPGSLSKDEYDAVVKYLWDQSQ